MGLLVASRPDEIASKVRGHEAAFCSLSRVHPVSYAEVEEGADKAVVWGGHLRGYRASYCLYVEGDIEKLVGKHVNTESTIEFLGLRTATPVIERPIHRASWGAFGAITVERVLQGGCYVWFTLIASIPENLMLVRIDTCCEGIDGDCADLRGRVVAEAERALSELAGVAGGEGAAQGRG